MRRAFSMWGLCTTIGLSLSALSASAQTPLRVGVHEFFPPQYDTDPQTHRPIGFAIDVMDALGDRIGADVDYVVYPTWTELIEALYAGQIDAIPNLGILPERAERVRFTTPVQTFQIRIFVRHDTSNIRGLEDLRGRPVAVVRSNVGVRIAESAGLDATVLPTPDEAIFQLLSGKVDALIYPEPPMVGMLLRTGLAEHIHAVGPGLLEVRRGVAVRAGAPDLLASLDAAVREFTATPEYAAIYDRWYGSPAPYWTVGRVASAMGGGLIVVVAVLLLWRARTAICLNRRIARSEARYRSLARNYPESAVLLYDGDLRITLAEGPLLADSGLHPEDLVGRPMDDFRERVGDDWPALESCLRGALVGRDGDIDVALPDGEVVEFLARPGDEIEHGVRGGMVVCRHVTERVRSREQVVRSLREKETLLREIHHRVKNNLHTVASLLDLEAGHLHDSEARDAFADSRNRVVAMGAVHEMLYQSDGLDRVCLPTYVPMLADRLWRLCARTSAVGLDVEVDDIELPFEAALPVALALAELICNALKHGFPAGAQGTVWLRISRVDDGRVRLTVRNDGLGLPEDFDPDVSSRAGLELVGMLAEQLDGTLEIDQRDGVAFHLTFACPPAEARASRRAACPARGS